MSKLFELSAISVYTSLDVIAPGASDDVCVVVAPVMLEIYVTYERRITNSVK